MSSIEIDIQDTINRGDELSAIAKQIKSRCNKTDTICDNSTNLWKGDAGNAYRKKLNQINSKIKSRAKSISNIADGISASANRYKKIEESINSIFT